jgi:hypothetical protein
MASAANGGNDNGPNGNGSGDDKDADGGKKGGS